MNDAENIHSSNSPIFLVGFMGAGKTTVGRALADQLGYKFIDLDDVIAAQTGKSVQQIFLELGEPEFRRIETETIRSCRNLFSSVIALGGGAYVSQENRDLLRGIGATVWLDCPVEVCLARIKGNQSRPLLGDEDAMRTLLENRHASYSLADLRIDSSKLSPDTLAKEIVRLLLE